MVVEAAVKLLLGCILAVGCYGQSAPASSPAGMENPWDVRTILANLNTQTEELRPLVTALNPQQWYQRKGAPSTYILQWQSAQQQIKDVAEETKLLSQKTDSLSLCLDEYFRMEALDVTMRSLLEGVRTYGDRPAADKLSELLGRSFSNRERFRDYIRDLAINTEQNFKIADEEAQRCRGIISKEPASNSKKLRK